MFAGSGEPFVVIFICFVSCSFPFGISSSSHPTVHQNFQGPLTPDLAKLSTLQFLGLSFNMFTGTVPTEFASLGRLINLELNGNLFDGSLVNAVLRKKGR